MSHKSGKQNTLSASFCCEVVPRNDVRTSFKSCISIIALVDNHWIEYIKSGTFHPNEPKMLSVFEA